MKNTRLAFSGVHGTGKSTLLKRVEEEIKEEVQRIDGLTRIIIQLDYNINDGGDDITQAIVLTDHLRRAEMRGNILLYDRCILDGWAYTKYLYNKNKVSMKTMNYADYVMKNTINIYNKIFFIEPEFETPYDGIRSTDKIFVQELNECFKEAIDKYSIKTTSLKGSVEERLSQVIQAIKELK